MTFKDMPLDLQVRLSLEKHSKSLGFSLNACGVGTYSNETGRDVCAAYKILSRSGKVFYIYFQVAYSYDPVLAAKVSKFSSIVLYDFRVKKVIAKQHMNSIEDIVTFYDAIDAILIDR